ncbi:MAG TPA: conjugal transfer protein TraM [Nitrosomonas sp.]|nr:conjugal transfer protein TraM [Nitrosomonas sp.]HMW21640.1 conjugal transfer protein TraM [Nitrosomonas sp.]HMW70116.1 conjugal transfer protein TraM [Nitrosomonas sp.]HMY62636.1 conjugal transfer protein TraM [Nitrosomonas sp.]HMY91465.1 conjugal transfer protein TraM [Nitrosomonas sp.]
MSNNRLDALIERVASEHGIVLSQDDPVLMMHTLNEVLLEQNEKAHTELLSNYRAILEENFNRWCEFSTKKSNAIISASMNNAQLTRDQFLESCIQLIDERIKSSINQETYDLVRISRQMAIMNLLAAVLVLVSVVIVVFMLL